VSLQRFRTVSVETSRIGVLLALVGFATASFADDCTAARSAMLNSGHTPKTATVTRIDGQGKKVVTRQVQTVTNKYVQTEDGKWYAMNIAIKDLNDDTDAKLTCRSGGHDSVNGESAAVYEIQSDDAGSVSDNKIWVSPKNLILKAEAVIEGAHYTTDYDYTHVTPPANFTAMPGR
jgi:hypothetical protein